MLKINNNAFEFTGIGLDKSFTALPGRIAIDEKNFLQLTLKGQEGLCMYLVNLALNIYPCLITTDEISFVDNDFAHATRNTLSITCALKSECNAELLTTIMQESYNSEFSIDLYECISEVNYLYKAIAWIKKYAL